MNRWTRRRRRRKKHGNMEQQAAESPLVHCVAACCSEFLFVIFDAHMTWRTDTGIRFSLRTVVSVQPH